MRRALRILGWFAVAGLVLGLAGLAFVNWVQLADARGLWRSAVARGAFLEDVAVAACARIEHVEQAARARDWRTERLATPQGDSLYRQDLPVALHVWVDPPVPFAKIGYQVLQFGADGCLAPRR